MKTHLLFSVIISFFVFVAISCENRQSQDSDSSSESSDPEKEEILKEIDRLYNEAMVSATRNTENAIDFIDSASTLAKSISDSAQIATMDVAKASLLTNFGLNDSALHYVNKSLLYFNQHDSVRAQILCQALLANIYLNLREFKRSQSITEEVIAKSRETNDTVRLIQSLGVKVRLSALMGNYNDGLQICDEIISLGEKFGSSMQTDATLISTHNILAGLHSELGDYPSAQKFHNKAIEIAKNRADTILIGLAYESQSFTLHKAGKTDEAYESIEEAEKYYQNINENVIQNQRLSRLKIEVLSELGRSDEALDESMRLIMIQDSMMIKSNKSDIEGLLYKLEKSNFEKDILQEKLKTTESVAQRNFITLGFSVAVVLITLVFIMYRRRVRANTAIKNHQLANLNQQLEATKKIQEMKIEHARKEAMLIKSEETAIHLHDTIANKLAATIYRIKNLAPEQKREDFLENINNNLLELYDDVRKIIEHQDHLSRTQFFSSTESYIDFIKDYFKGLPIDVDIQADSNLNMDKFPFETLTHMGLTLQEIFINAIKHSECTKIKIDTVRADQALICTISDNGIGFDLYNLDSEKTTGLNEIKRKIEKITGGVFSIESEPGKGTKITISISCY